MILCFGEILLRLQPSLKTNTADFFIGGAEANVAASLATWHIPVQYVSAMPCHSLALQVQDFLTEKNIDCSKMLWVPQHRIGCYYVQQGSDMKSNTVIYDRAHSAFANLQPNTIDWNEILNGVHWLHWSAITPAISANHYQIMLEILQAAAAKNIYISVDLNYRSKLWQYTTQPFQYMQPLVKYCHVIMGNIWAVENLLNITATIQSSEGQSKNELIHAANLSIAEISKQYPLASKIAFTFRLTTQYFGLLYQEGCSNVSDSIPLQNITDQVGTGDSFMAGLLYGIERKMNAEQTINFATAAAVSKFAIAGDFNSTPLSHIYQKASIT